MHAIPISATPRAVPKPLRESRAWLARRGWPIEVLRVFAARKIETMQSTPRECRRQGFMVLFGGFARWQT